MRNCLDFPVPAGVRGKAEVAGGGGRWRRRVREGRAKKGVGRERRERCLCKDEEKGRVEGQEGEGGGEALF